MLVEARKKHSGKMRCLSKCTHLTIHSICYEGQRVLLNRGHKPIQIVAPQGRLTSCHTIRLFPPTHPEPPSLSFPSTRSILLVDYLPRFAHPQPYPLKKLVPDCLLQPLIWHPISYSGRKSLAQTAPTCLPQTGDGVTEFQA